MSKVVVFDVDGTLFDTKPGIIKALNEVLHNFGKESISPADENKWIGPPVRNSFISFVGMNTEQAEEATKQYRQIYTDKYIAESVLYEGIAEVLIKLKDSGFHLCIATMKTQGQIERLLSLKKMTDVFEIVETAALDGSKTKADMLAFIKKQYSEENKFYMIGDTDGDYKATKKTNYNFIAINYGYGFVVEKYGKKMSPNDLFELINNDK